MQTKPILDTARDSVTIIVFDSYLIFQGTVLRGRRTKQGQRDVRYPLSDDLFKTVEHLMCLNRVANNVTSITKLRSCGNSTDYQVNYNKHNPMQWRA